MIDLAYTSFHSSAFYNARSRNSSRQTCLSKWKKVGSSAARWNNFFPVLVVTAYGCRFRAKKKKKNTLVRFRTIWILHRVQLSIVDTIHTGVVTRFAQLHAAAGNVCAYGFDASHALELSRVLSSLGELQPDADTCNDCFSSVGYLAHTLPLIRRDDQENQTRHLSQQSQTLNLTYETAALRPRLQE